MLADAVNLTDVENKFLQKNRKGSRAEGQTHAGGNRSRSGNEGAAAEMPPEHKDKDLYLKKATLDCNWDLVSVRSEFMM